MRKNSIRIITGNLMGKSIKAPVHARCVSSKVKKSVFEMLKDEIPGLRVLDLFAGSGALGIESLSLGAKRACFVDIRTYSCSIIKENLTRLNLLSSAEIVLKDAFCAVKDFHKKGDVFDVVFLDPPYYKGMLSKALQCLTEYDIVSPSSLLVGFLFFKDFNGKDFDLDSFRALSVKRHGDTQVVILRKI